MKQTLIFIILLIFVFGKTQTADEIIFTHLEKTGGIDNWNNLKTVKINGKAIFDLKESYNIEIIQKSPNLNKSFIFINNKKIILEGYDGKQGYKISFITGKKEIIKNYLPESFDSDLLNFKTKGFIAEYKGIEKINSQDCFVISLTKDNNSTTYYINLTNYTLIKEVKSDETLEYSNYKIIGGLKFAFRIESLTKKKEGDYTLEINSLIINKNITDAMFKY